MAARTQNYVCQNCGAAYVRWSGRCEACGEWNTLVEEGSAAPTARSSRKGRLFVVEPLKGEPNEAPRLPSGMAEFDRVTGGGLVRGSVLLLGGDPGIGKSTLLLEVAAAFARAGHRAVYISGRGSRGPGAAARRTAWSLRRRRRDCRGNRGRGYHRDAVARIDAAAFGHRLDPDHVDAARGSGARHGDAGARLGGRADPLRQEAAARR